MKANIVLRCDGHLADGFRFCSGVENVILDLETISQKSDYLSVIKYLDIVPKLFTSACFKPHVISNTLYKLYEWGYITEKMYNNFACFYEQHKRCGPMLIILPK